jgi:hypothetical protein
MVSGLEDNGTDVEWCCSDCGKVFSRLASSLAATSTHLEVWAARVGIPDRLVARLRRSVA